MQAEAPCWNHRIHRCESRNHNTQPAQSSCRSTLLLLPARQMRIRLFHCDSHLIHHLRFGKAVPTMATVWPIGDSRIGGRIGFLEKIIEQVNSIVQVVVVGFADGDVNFPKPSDRASSSFAREACGGRTSSS